MAQMKFTACGCGNQVSHDSKRCPKCGGKVAHPTSTFVKVLAAFCGFLILIIVIASFSTKPDTNYGPPSASASAVDPEMDMRLAVDDFERTIKAKLKDPDSYQRIRAGGAKDGSAVCVEFRSKNGFGGYTEGRALFLKQANTYMVTDMSQMTNGFAAQWRSRNLASAATSLGPRLCSGAVAR